MGLVTDLTIAKKNVKDIMNVMFIAAEKITKYYCKKYKVSSDQFTLDEICIGRINLYKTGTLVNNMTIPDWAFDEPERYIRERI